jgi:hypothetical protein
MDWSNLTKDEMWDILREYEIASEETITVVVNINGYTEDTMLDILYATTGFRNFEQLADDLDIEEDEEDWDEED